MRAEILESENVTREEVAQRIRERVWGFDEARMPSDRRENDMVINEMGGEIKSLIKQNHPNIVEEIDTDLECGPEGMIPEEQSKIRSQKAQKDRDQSAEEPPVEIAPRRCVGRGINEKTGDGASERVRAISRWAISGSGL